LIHKAQDAVAFFRSRGHFVIGTEHFAPTRFAVFARRGTSTYDPAIGEGYSGYTIEMPPMCRISADGETWLVWAEAFGEERYASLADAINAVLARLHAWLAEHPI
jgi:hypothetical protein